MAPREKVVRVALETLRVPSVLPLSCLVSVVESLESTWQAEWTFR